MPIFTQTTDRNRKYCRSTRGTVIDGARMVPFAGYQMPIQYTGEHGGIVTEHDWTRNSASLFDVSHMGQLIVSGDGAAQALETLLPGNIGGLKPGRIRYSLLLNDAGGILDDLMVTNISDAHGASFYVVVNGSMKWDDIAHLARTSPRRDHIGTSGRSCAACVAGAARGGCAGAGSAGRGRRSGVHASGHVRLERGDAADRARRLYRRGRVRDFRAERSRATLWPMRCCPTRACARPDWARATVCAWKRGCRYTVTTSTIRSIPVSAGLIFALTKSRRESGGWLGHAAVAGRAGGRRAAYARRLGAGRPFARARRVAGVCTAIRKSGASPAAVSRPRSAIRSRWPMSLRNILRTGPIYRLKCAENALMPNVAPMPFVQHRYYRGDTS